MSKRDFGVLESACCANCQWQPRCMRDLKEALGIEEARKWKAKYLNTHCCLAHDWSRTVEQKKNG